MTDLISLNSVTIGYGNKVVLRDVDLTVKRGEIITIVGPNGSGKTSMMRALIGALVPTTGSVVRPKAMRVGYVPQKLNIDLSFPITVRRFMSVPKRASAEQVSEAASLVGIEGFLDQQIATLSGGQFQRALLARAIIGTPDLLLLDEPTQGLDQNGAARFYQLITELKAKLDCAIVLVSHDLHVVMSASDRVICLNGHICCEGAPNVVSSAPEYRALFGTGTQGALALYQHQHDHVHDETCTHEH
jgi:zinc transport system ATP-binding protein